MLRYIINEKFIKLFTYISTGRNPSMRQISRHTNFHYMHILTLMKQFQEEDLINPIFDQEDADFVKNPGNPYKILLTNKGQALSKLLSLFYQLHKNLNHESIFKLLKITRRE